MNYDILNNAKLVSDVENEFIKNESYGKYGNGMLTLAIYSLSFSQS